jgi:hypothetical protein
MHKLVPSQELWSPIYINTARILILEMTARAPACLISPIEVNTYPLESSFVAKIVVLLLGQAYSKVVWGVSFNAVSIIHIAGSSESPCLQSLLVEQFYSFLLSTIVADQVPCWRLEDGYKVSKHIHLLIIDHEYHILYKTYKVEHQCHWS